MEEVLIPDCRSWLQSAKKMLPNVRFMRFYRLELQEKAGKTSIRKALPLPFWKLQYAHALFHSMAFFLYEFYVIHSNIPRDVYTVNEWKCENSARSRVPANM